MSTQIKDPNQTKNKLEELVRRLHDSDRDERDYLTGRLLTIIDASFTDPEQRKAVKDLVKSAIWNGSPLEKSNIQFWVEQYAQSEGVELFEEEHSTTNTLVENPFNKI